MRMAYELNGNKMANTKPIIVNSVNRLLLQKFKLDKFEQNKTNHLKLEINGTGIGLIQVNVKYSIKKAALNTNQQPSKFMLSLTTDKISCKHTRINVNTTT
jgi:hypothetical protein